LIGFWLFEFRILKIVSDFEIRISDFDFIMYVIIVKGKAHSARGIGLTVGPFSRFTLCAMRYALCPLPASTDNEAQ
jgi:hypothetical protein